MKFGQRLYQLRVGAFQKKISQLELAELIGTSRQYIDNVEKGKLNTAPPTLGHCKKLADFFELSNEARDDFFNLAFRERCEQKMPVKALSGLSAKFASERTQDYVF